MAYTDTHNTDIYAIVCRIHTYCVDCAVKHLFNNDENAFLDVDAGLDTSCVTPNGVQYDIIHEGSIHFEVDPDNFYPGGLYCDTCGSEVLAPQEDYCEEV